MKKGRWSERSRLLMPFGLFGRFAIIVGWSPYRHSPYDFVVGGLYGDHPIYYT